MRRKGLWLSVLATAMIAGTASAATIQSAGSPSWGLNWGTYGGTASQQNNAEWRHYNLSLADVDYRSAVGVYDGDPAPGALGSSGLNHDTTYPGSGGQNYDAEEVFYYFDGDSTGGYLHLGLVTGFNPYGELSGVGSPAPSIFHAGDLFVDLGNDGTRDIAIALGLGEGRSGSAWVNSGGVGNEVDPYYDGTPNPDYALYSAPYRLNESGPGVVQFGASDVRIAQTLLWSTGAAAGPGPSNTNSQRWFYEARLFLDGGSFDLDAILGTAGPGKGLGLHWTMECGNDYIHVTDSTPFAPVVPVPAAAPMALLGMALVSLVRRKRQAKC